MNVNPNLHAFLGKLTNVKPCGGNQWTAYCPHHENDGGTHTSSLSVRATDDGRILVNCHAGCDPKQVVYSTGFVWGDMFPPKQEQPKQTITAEYPYEEVVDGERITRFQVVRLEPNKSGVPGTKDFRQRQPDGKGGWTWKTKGLTKIPYRLPELLTNDTGQPVFIVEGEKQVDYLRSLGLNATCNPGGAGKWLKSFSKYFTGRDVVIVPDCDPPNERGVIVGAEHARVVADTLLDAAQSIHVIELPDCLPKWGLDDWLLKGGHTLEDLGRILSAADPWGPESTLRTRVETGDNPDEDPFDRDRKLLEEIGITYVAQIEESGEIEIFSSTTQKFAKIKSAARLPYEDLILLAGLPVRRKVRQNSEDEGKLYSLSQVRVAISAVASMTSSAGTRRGIGCWENADDLVIVSNRRLTIIDRYGKIRESKYPIHGRVTYDVSDGKKWVDVEKLRSDIEAADRQQEYFAPSVHQARELFAQWRFADSGPVPEVLAGLVMATYLQTIWDWRPQIFLVGQAYSGKTTLLKTIANIMGPIAHVSSNSSAAGIRQDIESSGIAIMCDELEQSKHRAEILEMIRACGRGDVMQRGTASQTGVRRYRLQHMFWCAATESGLRVEADQSRFIVIELQKSDTPPSLPAERDLTALGQMLLPAVIHARARIHEMLRHLLENKPVDAHGRICESYALPVAVWGATTGMSRDSCHKMFSETVHNIGAENEIQSDHEQLLEDIGTAIIRTGFGSRAVHELLQEVTTGNSSGLGELLPSYGVHVNGDRIFLNTNGVARHLLGQDWQGKQLTQIIKRVDGYRCEGRRTLNGTGRLRWVSIPLESMIEGRRRTRASP